MVMLGEPVCTPKNGNDLRRTHDAWSKVEKRVHGKPFLKDTENMGTAAANRNRDAGV